MRKKVRVLLFSFLCFAAAIVPLRAGDEDIHTKSTRAMLVSAHPLATDAGVSVLREGGNAIDAAAAVQMVLNVVEPQASGIGGGCFLVYFDKARNQVIAVDGREEAPRDSHSEMFLDETGKAIAFYPDRITGGKAAGVPGCLRALRKAWEQYGSQKVSWDRLFAEGIRLAEEGFPVSKNLAGALEGEKKRLVLFPASRAVFFDETGQPLKEGDRLIQSDLAATFKLIAAEGVSVFYEGEIARDIVKAVQEAPRAPGKMTLEDLKDYEAPLREPVKGTYRGFEIYSMPPPSSGGVTLIEALNILEHFRVDGTKRTDANFLHLFSEVQKLAFADRDRYLADPDFVEVPVRDLLSKELALTKSLAIDPRRAIQGRAPASTLGAFGNTTTSHISIVDSYGNVLAMTTTIEHIFGSAMVVPGRGFVLNNELTDFRAEPYLDPEKQVAAPNHIEGGRRERKASLDLADSKGGKRPLSSMSPTLVFKDGKPFAALGSPGGTQIIGIVLNILVNVIDFGMNAEQAVAAPRLINRNGAMEMEQPLLAETTVAASLQARGHDILPREPLGNAQVIVIREGNPGELEGASDPRGEGTAGGF